MIYIIKNGDWVKIGYSNDPVKRIADIQVSSPVKLEPLLVIEGSRNYEKELHHKFCEKRSRGEWFNIDNDIIEFIEEESKNDLRFALGIEDVDINPILMPVRKHRIDCALTLEELGYMLNITRQGAMRLEQSASAGTITLNRLKAIADVTGYVFEFRFRKLTKSKGYPPQ